MNPLLSELTQIHCFKLIIYLNKYSFQVIKTYSLSAPFTCQFKSDTLGLFCNKIKCFTIKMIMKEVRYFMSELNKVDYLKERLENFLHALEEIDPETTELADIDRLISMVDDLEEKMKEI